MAERTHAIVGLGANLGAREAAMRIATAMLDDTRGCEVVAVSRVYDTAPMGPPQPRYRNAAVRVQTELSPEALLDVLLGIERRLGRDRAREVRWGPRPLDLDLLYRFDGPFRSARLTVPHPGLADRAFALAPLLDVAPELTAYATRLAQLGETLAGEPMAGLPRVVDGEVEVDDDADGLALGLTALVRDAGRLDEDLPFSFEGPEAPGALPPFVAGAVSRGFDVGFVSLSACSETLVEGRLHGAPGRLRPISLVPRPAPRGRLRWALRPADASRG